MSKANRCVQWLAACVVLVFVPGGQAAPSLDWQVGPGFRRALLAVPPAGRAGFTLCVGEATGVTFTNTLPEARHLTNQILLNGAGVAAGDVDGDGWCDLYFCSCDGRNALYRNLGQWRFEDITESAGVACAGLASTGAAFADLDGDGDLDLIVNTVGNGTQVFFNDGKGRFAKAPLVLNENKGGMSLALGDVDGDGYLDLYLANYRTSALMDMPNARATFKRVKGQLQVETVNGRPVTEPDLADRFIIGPRGDIQELGEADVFYQNQGGTNFVPVPFTGGRFLDEDGKPLTQPPLDWSLTATFRDANADTLPDLYVCSDFQTPDRFWLNQGDGRFRLLPRLAQRKASLFSMAVDFADINRDGFYDFLVLDMMSREHQQRMRYLGDRTPPIQTIGFFDDRPQYGLNTLFLNRGDFTFAEIAQLSGVEASEWSWSCVFLDVDLDGWEDLLIINGMERAARDLDVAERLKDLRASRQMSDTQVFQARRLYPRLATANLAFRNRGDLTFEEVGSAWGFSQAGVSQGLALADLDNDGDLDVVINNLNEAPFLLRNDSAAPRLGVRLRGLPPNTHGIGARITVIGGPVALQTHEMICGGRYLSGDDTLRTFACGATPSQLRIEVTWRSGRRSVIERAAPDSLYEIDESQAESAQPEEKPRTPAPWFNDVSALVSHQHREEPFDDFVRQPLLPNKLSQLGPGITWFDVDGDGWEDLLIPSGKGGRLAVYRNDAKGGFAPFTAAPFEQLVTRDQTSLVGWRVATNRALVFVGSANYEDGLALGPAVQQFDFLRKTIEDVAPATDSSSGPLALADVNNDGSLDLFVGGRVVPGRYPAAASARLFLGSAGKFVLDEVNTKTLQRVGLVSGAAFSDLNADGAPDLVLACEWGPIRVFLNQSGQLREVTREWGLDQYLGWWTSVAAGDFDGDGRMDLVAGNWGRNTKYQAHRSRPLQVFHGDLDEDGLTDVVEACYDSGLGKIVPMRQLDVLTRSLPFLRERYNSHRSFSTASVEEALGERFAKVSALSANWLESTVFLNRTNRFEARVLPVEAQMAPVFGLCVADCDGDGHEDVFVAQNFFATQPETPRYDAGRALWLTGNGKGGFRPLSAQESGVAVYGEARGAAVGDYDGDGRVDLAVAQNGAATKLYRNVRARPGLRIRLVGLPGNLDAVGATVRLLGGQTAGPAREVRAGSGYWSQDGAVQVVSLPEPPTHVWVRWPGGKVSLADVPPGATAVTLNWSGTVTSP